MKRELATLLFSATVVLVTAAACEGSTESACEVDTDCPQGTICREKRCGPVGADASTAPTDAAPAGCSSDDLSCTAPDECCSRQCTAGRCGAPEPPPAPSCRGIYELCQGDCCAGLTCTAGTCR